MLFAEESITITTYYPSPYGVYNELQLYPHDPAVTTCDDAHKGTMFYKSTDDQVYVCKGTTLGWQLVGGSAPSGAVTFFNLASCPSGWTELTSARGRYIVGLPSGGTLAGTNGTALTNLEDRPVGQHSHSITDPGHSHYISNGPVYGNGAGAAQGASSTGVSMTGITINNAGSVAGTNAPYIQLLVCQKN